MQHAKTLKRWVIDLISFEKMNFQNRRVCCCDKLVSDNLVTWPNCRWTFFRKVAPRFSVESASVRHRIGRLGLIFPFFFQKQKEVRSNESLSPFYFIVCVLLCFHKSLCVCFANPRNHLIERNFLFKFLNFRSSLFCCSNLLFFRSKLNQKKPTYNPN